MQPSMRELTRLHAEFEGADVVVVVAEAEAELYGLPIFEQKFSRL